MKKIRTTDIQSAQIRNLRRTAMMLYEEFDKGYYNPNIVKELLEEIQDSCEILKSEENYKCDDIITKPIEEKDIIIKLTNVTNPKDEIIKEIKEIQNKLSNLTINISI